MCATSRALREHGYADLTMQDIADESELSKAALHYHYDSKRELLVAFLEFVSEQFLAAVREAERGADGPDERLAAVLDTAVAPPAPSDLAGLRTALLELRAQAPYVAAYRERSRESDAELRDIVAGIVADGVAAGDFRADADPEAVARLTVTILAGGLLRGVSVGAERERTRTLLARAVEDRLRPREVA
jgi:AcrR family transcriptional regulator